MNLQLEPLLDAASQQTGLSDYGDPAFREPLQVLLQSLEADAALNAIGEVAAPTMIHELLVNRLQLVDTRKRHPEMNDEPIRGPIFILGLPRTGTTLLYGLLAADPAHRTPLAWEVAFPCPPPERTTYEGDARIAQSEARFEMLYQIIPEFRAIHPMGGRYPQECVAITAHEFMGVLFNTTYRVTAYEDWLEAQDTTRWISTYEAHRRFLQHLQWKCPGERWVLKSPGHLLSLDAQLDAYPDAVIIQTHRHPVEVMAWLASLHAVLRSATSDDIQPRAIGREVLDRFGGALDRAMNVRARRTRDADRFIDIHYRDFVADPLGCVRGIYAQLGFAYPRQACVKMQAYMEANPKDTHGAHTYTLEAYGLDATRVFERCQRYCEGFGYGKPRA